ncbi:MAG: LysE family translocator [Gammaproteobacteria bacterium]
MLMLLLKGLLIGFAIAAPVGPIGVLCIQRSLQNGFKIGLMTGMGAAFADGTYGLVAGFGLTAISFFLIKHQIVIRIVGGVYLLYLGIKLFSAKPQESALIKNPDKSLWHAFATTYFLTLTNPATILSFVAIFAGLGLGTENSDVMSAIILVLGIILGSAAWWLLLSGGVAFILQQRMTQLTMRYINRMSGSIIMTFGIFSLKVW